jgi:hypothetical protein
MVVNRDLANKIGLTQAILFGQLCSLQDKLGDNFFFTQDKLSESCCISVSTLKRSLSDLVKLGYIKTQRRGIPCKTFYSIRWSNLIAQNELTRESKMSQLESPKRANIISNTEYSNKDILTNQKQIGQKRTMSDKSKRLELELEKDIIQEPCEQKIDYDKILDLFKTHCCNKDSKIPIPNSLTPSRKKALNARIKDYNIDGVIAVFNTVGQSDFLTGKKSKWCASFDWILNPTNFAKIIEGNYMNKLKTSKTSSNYNDIEDDESCGF